MKFKKYWYKYKKELYKRLLNGFREYGDASFKRSSADLIKELQQETLDVAGWGLILWVKLEEMKKEMRNEKQRKNCTFKRNN